MDFKKQCIMEYRSSVYQWERISIWIWSKLKRKAMPFSWNGAWSTKRLWAEQLMPCWMIRCNFYLWKNCELNLIKLWRYSESATRVSLLLRDQPETPLERAVFWTEHVLRHNGTRHLELGSRNLNFYQRALIDVYAIIITICILPFILFGLCVRRCCCKKRKSSLDVDKKTQ